MLRALFLAMLLPLTASAQLVREVPFEPASSIADWQKSFAAHAEAAGYPDDFAECRAVSALPGAIFCQFLDQESMNKALARATAFVEGNAFFPKGSLAPHNSEDLGIVNLSTNGHDLKGEDLEAFYAAAQAACEKAQDPTLCLSPAEEAFRRGLVEPARLENPSLVVITFSNDQPEGYSIAVHEILHAQYFLDASYREAVDAYWNEDLAEEGRSAVRGKLSYAYDASNEYLMRNEFQAYLLQPGAEQALLAQFVPLMRKPLLLRLEQKGVRPLSIK